MSQLKILIDYDNVENRYTSGGPVVVAQMFAEKIPEYVVKNWKRIIVRLYGGWRSNDQITPKAQGLVADITKRSPTTVTVEDGRKINLSVELATIPLGERIQLSDTYMPGRNLRNFRVLPQPWQGCSGKPDCKFLHLKDLASNSGCASDTCSVQLADLLVRNEQKMVDTMIVADIAHAVFIDKDSEIIVVSSDVDIWPGILLAARAGCAVVHMQAKKDQKTPPRLLRTISPNKNFYHELQI